MREDPDLRRHLRDLEEQLVKPAARSSREKLEELLTEDFVEFGSSGGIHDREIDLIGNVDHRRERRHSGNRVGVRIDRVDDTAETLAEKVLHDGVTDLARL